MVINFSLIPSHIKVNIAEKIDFWDLLQFEQSSKLAVEFVNSVQHRPVLHVDQIGINESKIRFFIKSPDEKNTLKKDWQLIRTFPNLPRFSVKSVETWPGILVENIVQFKQEATFIPNKIRLVWQQQGEKAKEILQTLTEIFNVSHFQSSRYPDDPDIIYMPLFQQLEVVSRPVGHIPDEVFLNLKAHTIEQSQLSSSPSVGPTLNRFFHQWFCNEREICNLYIWADQDEPANQPKVLFTGLPTSFLWNSKTHESSIISSFSLEEVQPAALTDNVYMIDRGDKKLLVFIDFNILLAEETTDEKSCLINSISKKD